MGWQWHQMDPMQIICTSVHTDNHASTSPLSSCRPDALPGAQPTASEHWRLSCLEDKRENYQNCSMLCRVQQLCAMIHTCKQWVLMWLFVLGLDLVFVCLLKFSVLCFYVFSLDCFIPVLFAFVVLGLVSSVLHQEIGWEEHLQNDLFYVE